MGKEVSNKIVITLVIIAIAVSLASTYIVTVYVGNMQPITVEKTIQKNIMVSPPVSSTGYVAVEVLPKKQEEISNG